MTDECSHDYRFTTIGGDSVCETCARIEQGWKTCRKSSCKLLTHPDEVYCESHTPEGATKCPECDGEGWYECQEFGCHGEYCEEGETDCIACEGTGVVTEEAAA